MYQQSLQRNLIHLNGLAADTELCTRAMAKINDITDMPSHFRAMTPETPEEAERAIHLCLHTYLFQYVRKELLTENQRSNKLYRYYFSMDKYLVDGAELSDETIAALQLIIDIMVASRDSMGFLETLFLSARIKYNACPDSFDKTIECFFHLQFLTCGDDFGLPWPCPPIVELLQTLKQHVATYAFETVRDFFYYNYIQFLPHIQTELLSVKNSIPGQHRQYCISVFEDIQSSQKGNFSWRQKEPPHLTGSTEIRSLYRHLTLALSDDIYISLRSISNQRIEQGFVLKMRPFRMACKKVWNEEIMGCSEPDYFLEFFKEQAKTSKLACRILGRLEELISFNSDDDYDLNGPEAKIYDDEVVATVYWLRALPLPLYKHDDQARHDTFSRLKEIAPYHANLELKQIITCLLLLSSTRANNIGSLPREVLFQIIDIFIERNYHKPNHIEKFMPIGQYANLIAGATFKPQSPIGEQIEECKKAICLWHPRGNELSFR